MTATERYQIAVDDLHVDVIRKRIKTLRLTVYPPDGRVRVSAPTTLSDEAVRRVVVDKIDWIRRKQARMRLQVRESPREMVTGEVHYYRGQRYGLNIIEVVGRQFVSLNGSTTIDLHARPGSDIQTRRAVLERWYREQLCNQIPGLVAKWEPIVGVEIAEWRIKRMKTRWGTCNIDARRIWLNLELAKRPQNCLEYVVVHEMVHLHERLHNKRFWSLMDRFMPQWRVYRDELSQRPLARQDLGRSRPTP